MTQGEVAGGFAGPAPAPRGRKLRVLLCWGYQRRSWVEPFEALADQFEFTFLHYLAPENEERRFTELPVTYWSRYATVDRLLDELRPDRIVMMSISDGRSIALNLAARRRGIPRLVLQHGLLIDYEDQTTAEARSLGSRARWVLPDFRAVQSALFLASALRPADLATAPRLLQYLVEQRRQNSINVVKRYAGPFFAPTKYLCFTMRDANSYRQLYGATDGDIELLGIPEFDKFFTAARPAVDTATPYVLLLDTPIAHNRWNDHVVSVDDAVAFYTRLNAFAKARGMRLKVKLHPESFADDWRPQDPNIDWIKEADKLALIGGASLCFSFLSTIMLPAMVITPVCLIRAVPLSVIDDLAQMGVAAQLPFEGFDPEQFEPEKLVRSGPRWDAFVEKYLYRLDGRATERLGRAIAAERARDAT